MSILRIVKRDPTAINTLLDFNPSVFRYYVDVSEVKKLSVRDGLKTAFAAMLDELLRPDSDNLEIDGNWSFYQNELAAIGIGGQAETINTYTGVKYVYRQAVQTLLTALIPATMGSYVGRTFKSTFNPMTMGSMYVETNNLDEVTHGELVQNGQANQFLSIENLGGTPRVGATFQTTNAGYSPIQSGEQGTHGQDEFQDYRPLSYWNETVETTTTTGGNEYYGTLTESNTGFVLNTKRILFSLSSSGDALERYNPIDLATFANLIKLNYSYRNSAPVEIEM